MNKLTVPDIKKVFKQASEIAHQVPESLQEAAFNRAIDLLTGGGEKQESVVERSTLRNKSRRKTIKQAKTEEDNSSANDLLSAINSTKYPSVTSSRKILERSLMVLQLALTDHCIDGLKPNEIAKILTEKFRVNTTSAAVRMALGRSTNLVNRVPSGSIYRYQIMKSGEKYLSNLSETESAPSLPKKKKLKKKTTNKGGNAKKKTVRKNSRVAMSGRKKAQSTGKVGPKAAVIILLDSGFFSIGRTGPEVKAHLKKKRGFNFGIDQIRVALLRLVRDVSLDRDENAEGQYEYKKPKS